jgi:mono/diheme cytochrome c family protein
MLWVVLLWAQSAVDQQVQRGQALFLDASQGCASCHALKGHGAAVGPDLSVMGRLSPAAIATAVRSTVTEYVQTVSLKSGESFPGMPAGQDEKNLNFYDLSKTPPRAAVQSTVGQDAWKHPPSAAGYTGQQLADIVAYIRYAVTGAGKTVTPADIE